MSRKLKSRIGLWLGPTALAGALCVAPAPAAPGQDQDQGQEQATQQEAPSPPDEMASRHSRNHLRGVPPRATMYYQSAWGIDNLLVRRTASGSLIRFSYRVTDAERAKPLGEKEVMAQLISAKRGVALAVPVMEKVGQLRQTGTPVVGKEYWMVFSNKGDIVKAGDRVDVLIGGFHAKGLLLE